MNNENNMEVMTEETKVEEPKFEKTEDSELLTAAAKETKYTEYTEATPMEISDQIPGVGPAVIAPEEIKETTKSYEEAMEAYDLTNKEAELLFNTIESFKSGNRDIYMMLPEKIKIITDGIVLSSIKAGAPVTKNQAACFIIDELIKDAKFNTAFDEYTNDFSTAIAEANAEFDNLIGNSINDTFAKIDEIRESDPEKAKKIQLFKDAFEKAGNFDVQLEWLNKASAKFINKKVSRYTNEVFYVNKKLNTTSIKIPDLTELEPIIKMVRPELSSEDIKKFIIVLCLSIQKLDIDMGENIGNLAYVYKLINNIYMYKFASYVGEEAEKVFGGITEVINKINNL